MLLARLRSGPVCEIVAALLLALVTLSGVAQARVITEKASANRFASAFELCLQSGHGAPAGPTHDHDCDECRIPGVSSGIAAFWVGPAFHGLTSKATSPVVRPIAFGPSLHLPEARGPPVLD